MFFVMTVLSISPPSLNSRAKARILANSSLISLPSVVNPAPEILEKSFDTAKDDDKDPEKFQEVNAEHHSFC